MKRIVFLIAMTLTTIGCLAQNPGADEIAIRKLLAAQEVAWNQGNIEEFMQGYWKSDSLMFIGNPITYGWNSTLARYQKTYPNRAAMGVLKFTFYEFKFVSADACLVTGKYHLKRTSDEPNGMFTLLLRKKKGGWVIVYDHTS